jgi:phosphopantothenoylcysteine decarboxylase/phosphopantothenate--cysteine ligase
LALASTPDILKTTKRARRAGAVIVGFALETHDALASGKQKLGTKDLDMIVVNDATEPGAGFGVDTNRVTFLLRDGGEERLPLMAKTEVADAILDRVERLIGGR